MAEPLRRVGRYELMEVIGRGGTAVVYLANQPDLNRQVALKELSPHHAGDPRFAERFIAEARLSAALNHANIVTVHEFFEHDGLPYIAMEYLPRGSLRPYLSTLTLPQIFGVAESVLAGLATGESHRIIHRDLKPENLLVSADGQIKIADYGVARALNTVVPRPYATMTGTTIGTPAYMAPEQALGEPLGPEADLYSLGIILWEALACRPPFGAADTPMAVLYQKIHEPVPRITELEADVDPGLAQWLDVMLAKSPALRISSASAAWDELEEVAIKLLGPRWRRDARITIEAGPTVPAAGGSRPIAVTQTDGPAPSPPRAASATLPGAEPHVQWRRTTDPLPTTRRISPSTPERAAPALGAAGTPPAAEPPLPPRPSGRSEAPAARPSESEVPAARPSESEVPAPRPPEPPRTPDAGAGQGPRPAIWSSLETAQNLRAATPRFAPPGRPGVVPGADPAHHTIVRNSRRHLDADDDLEGPEDVIAPVRWGPWAAVALLVLVAAGAGVGVGIGTTPAAPAASTRTVTTPQQHLATTVRPIIDALIRRQDQDMKLLDEETTAAGQAAIAGELHVAFLHTEAQLYDLPAAEKRLAPAGTLFAAVKGMTLAWDSAYLAATAKNRSAYNAARKLIAAGSPRLADAAASAGCGTQYVYTVTAASPTTPTTPGLGAIPGCSTASGSGTGTGSGPTTSGSGG